MKLSNMFSASALTGALVLGLMSPVAALAATTPSLGAATTFGVLSSTFTNTTPTTVNGDVGFTNGPAVAPFGVQSNYGPTALTASAGNDQNAALAALGSQACTFTFAPGAIDLSTDLTHGSMGVYTPGVYCTSGAASVGTGGISLLGPGTYIFRVNGALNTAANSAVTLIGGAVPNDVFFTPSAATTLGANSTFVGNIIDAPGITLGSGVNMTGRALAFGGTVTTTADTISVPGAPVTSPPVVVSAATTTSTVTTTAVPTSVTTVTTTAVPTTPLPNAGYGPDENSTPWNAVVPAIVFLGLATYFVSRKNRVA